jgi:uncharacterized phage-associated protein
VIVGYSRENVNTVKDILLSLLSEAEHKNYPVGKTQLVKYLYLVELDYFMDNKKRLTDLEWKFYHYGPYAFELESILELPEFAKKEFPLEGGKTYQRFALAESLQTYDLVDTKVSLIIKRVIGQWGNKSLRELLDYVYFDTEPMEAVKKRGDVLDFSTIRKEMSNVVIPLKASKKTEEQIAELRRHIAPTLKRFGEQRIREIHKDKDYEEAMRAWNEDMNKDFDPEALKNIILTITELPHDTNKKGN